MESTLRKREPHIALWSLLISVTLIVIVAVPPIFRLMDLSQAFQSVAAGNVQQVTTLLGRGVDVNATLNDDTLLHTALRSGDDRMVRLLLDHGAKVNARNRGWTPLTLAQSLRNMTSMQTLLERGADPNAIGNVVSPLFVAQSQAEAEMLLQYGALINARDNLGETSLMVACRPPGHTGVVVVLLAHHADVNTRNPFGQTALFYAVQNHEIENVSLLLKAGSDVTIRDSQGNTPLQTANRFGYKDIATMLNKSHVRSH